MKTLLQQFLDYIHAGYSAFYFQTAETSRIKAVLTEINQQLNLKIREYDLAYGELNEYFQPQNKTADPSHILEQILDLDFEQEIIYVRGIKALLQHNPLALNRLRFLIEKVTYQYKNECIIVLQDSELFLPKEIEPFITLLELPHPKETEIKALINAIHLQVESAILPQLITSLSGLTELDIQQLLTLIKNRFKAISKQNKTEIFEEIQQSKEQIIAKSGVLEMVKVTNTIDDIGGLENLKQWVKDQSYILANLAQSKAFGVKAPKGTLIVGMPGCGKSLTAKATATLFQQPLLRLDIGSLLGKYIGESETNMRRALAMAESISPCVLWVDELEKAFVGMSGNNASEVSSRLLGYFLTWLQEKTAPVFIVATANDITALPPELLRKGRFDEIFYVGFPNTTERKQILSIHLKKAKQKVEKFDLSELARLCRDYSGADIENAVYEGVKQAFIKQEKSLTTELLEKAIEETTPLRKTLKDKVGEYEKKFDELYLTNASLDDGLSIAQMNKMAKDPNYLERLKVAQNENATEDLLEELANDKELEVRKAVFSNANCPTKLLDAELVANQEDDSENDDIIKLVIKHKNLSFNLALDYFKKNQRTRSFGITLKTSLEEEFMKNPNVALMSNVDKIMQATDEIKYQYVNHNLLKETHQKVLIENCSDRVKIALIRKYHLIPSIEKQLSTNKDLSLLLALSKVAKTSEAQINILSVIDKRRDEFVYSSVEQSLDSDYKKSSVLLKKILLGLIFNQHLTEEFKLLFTKNYCLSHGFPPRISFFRDISAYKGDIYDFSEEKGTILSKYHYGSYDLYITCVFAGYVELSEEIQEIMIGEGSYLDIRYALAQNKSLSKKVHSKLLEDGESRVRYVAKTESIYSS